MNEPRKLEITSAEWSLKTNWEHLSTPLHLKTCSFSILFHSGLALFLHYEFTRKNKTQGTLKEDSFGVQKDSAMLQPTEV
jgi:hypothetical protein